ncbi:glycosyltransferase family 4 protein [Treponema sp. OttesenSCG-928-L16]|nr:glycosyltransferase family 4 protein [Treponema sp. OttesenSCG-928-L16]
MNRILEKNETRPEAERYSFTFIHYKKSDNPIYKKVRELIVPRNPLFSASVLRREAFDLVHYTPLTIYAPIYCVPNRKTATIHGAEQLLLPHFFGPLEMFHERYLVPIFARKMDGILTVSNTTKKYLADHFKVRPERITVAYNGIGPEYRPRPPEELSVLKKFGISRKYIFHISRFSERKNPWTLLSSFSQFIKKGNYPHLLICAGKGWDNPEVEKRIAQLGIADRFLAVGFVSDDEASQFMNGADAFVFPSFAEGFGMPNVEAFASACPVITSSAFAIPEIVDGAALIIEDPSDAEGFAEAMQQVIEDVNIRNELIAKGLERVGLFSWEEAAGKLMDMYDRILK